MALLDTADREWCSVKPKLTNTPLQALALMNDVTFTEAARKLAEQLVDLEVDHDADRINYAFKKLAARSPTSQESAVLLGALETFRDEFVKNEGQSKLVLRLGESLVESKGSPIEIAAFTALVNVISNLEEATTRE